MVNRFQPTFDGFQPEDFDALKGSTWRNRNALGGVLATALRHQTGQPYQSWGVRRRLELHIAQEGQYDFDYAFPYAKLFVSSNPMELAFGFYIETPPDNDPRYDSAKFIHWRNFKDRLQRNATMREALLAAMANHNLVMTNYYEQETGGALGCKFAFHGGRLQWWRPDEPVWRNIEADDLIRRIARLPEDRWVDLHVFARIERDEAIEMRHRVVDPILTVLRALTPVYEMTINPRW